MSEYDEEVYSRERKHHNHKEKITVEERGYSTASLWGYGFLCIVVTFFIVIFLVSIIYWSGQDNFQHHMNNVIDELVNQNTQQTDSTNMISFSSLAAGIASQAQRLFKNNRLAICYTDLLETSALPGDMKQVVALRRVKDQLVNEEGQFSYALDFKMTMEFDVDTSKYTLNSQRLDQSQRYMTMTYKIDSDYAAFSTIKLVESGLDSRTHRRFRTKEVILCSNNPMHMSRACTSGGQDAVGIATKLFFKNTKLVTMSRLVPWVQRQPQGGNGGDKNATKPSNSNNKPSLPPNGGKGGGGQGGHNYNIEQYDIVQGDNKINSYKLEEDATRDLRFYNVEFYTATADPQDRSNSFTEHLSLTVRPNKCK